jgi:glucosamine-6-phosphate deaminase
MMYTVVPVLNIDEFGQKATDAFVKAASSYRKPPSVILPTGNTPLPFYQALIERAKTADDVPAFEYCQLDEYLGLPEHHPKTFLNQIREQVLDPLDARIKLSFNSAAHPAPQIDGTHMKFVYSGHPDIAVLGIGANGHVGFNEPGCSFHDGVHVVQLASQTIRDNSRDWDIEKYGAFPTRAITLGIQDLKKAQQTILLVRGAAKAEILAKALTGDITSKVPASYLQEQRNVTVIADTDALSMMPPSLIYA